MSTLCYSPFTLYPRSSVNSKHSADPINGFNFKMDYKGFNLFTSYTLHPELGDLNPALFIESLKKNVPYVIQENFKAEYQLKKNQKYFLDYMNHDLKTHATIRKNELAEEDLKVAMGHYKNGFKRLKFKVNSTFFIEHEFYLTFLNRYIDVEFIFDFNSTAQISDLLKLNWDQEYLNRVYWEDPIPLNPNHYMELKAKGFRLIFDQKDMVHHQRLLPYIDLFEVVAVKPTKESVDEVLRFFPEARILVTTNMGDEMDHVISSYWANYIFKNHPNRFFGAGLYTRHFFNHDLQKEHDPKVRSSFLNLNLQDHLYGWGLDQEMSRKHWQNLKDIEIEF